jgi:hypothetical protein
MVEATSSCLNPTMATDFALRGRICLFLMQTEHAGAFHLGNLVRIAFMLAYLTDASFDTVATDALTRAEAVLIDVTTRATHTGHWRLSCQSEVDLIEILLDAYEELMASVPVQTLLAVHQRIEANFDAPIDQRRSIRAVLAGDPL